MECEICGRRAKHKIALEGTLVNACESCSGFGRVVRVVAQKIKKTVKTEPEYSIRPDLGLLVKNKRQKLGLTQEQLARELGIKSSFVARIEAGWQPPENIVRRLEKFLNISLKQDIQNSKISTKVQNIPATIGDVAEIKVKKSIA